MAEEAENDVKNTVETTTAAPESSSEETNDGGVIAIGPDGSTEEKEVDTMEKPEDKTEGESETEASNAESEPRRKNAETRKQQLNNEIRDKIAERNALRDEIAELNRQKYQLRSVDDIPTVDALMDQQNPETGDYYTRMEAKLARLEAERELEREQRQLDEYNEKIVDNRLRLKDEASQALKDFPMFDEESGSYNKDLADQANQIAERLIIVDENTGQIVGSRGSIYEVYAALANAAKVAETNGKISGRKAAVDMMNSADVLGSSGSITEADDDDNFMAGLNKS